MPSNVRNLKRGRSSDHFRILFENAADALLVIDVETAMIIDANRPAEILLGAQPHCLPGMHAKRMSPPFSRRYKCWDTTLLGQSGFYEDLMLQNLREEQLHVSLSVNSMEVHGAHVALCILRDVGMKRQLEEEIVAKHTELRTAYLSLERKTEELKSMQEALVQAGKLAALGELAAGVAHELNQPLTAIRGFAQEARLETRPETIKSYLDEIVSASRKMEKIIKQLRTFTRKSTEDFQWIQIHDVIEESLLMMHQQLKIKGITIEKEFSKDIPAVYCNPFQLEQVFINLTTNARDAIEQKGEKGGRITIRTNLETGNKFIRIQYQDNGCGMNEKMKSKIWNPFFTTKEVGGGMGLGLSISHSILSKINASIIAESTPGVGSTFTIQIPIDYRNH